MLKKPKSLLPALLCTLFVANLANTDTRGQKLTNTNPDDIIFAWDIHHVLAKPLKNRILNNLEYSKLIALYAKAAGSWVAQLFNKKESTENQKLVDEAIKMRNSGDASGEGFYHIFKKYGHDDLAQMVLNISNGYEPIAETLELVAQLKALGYTNRTASNIGDNFYTKFSEKYPKMFKDFDEGATVTFVENDGTIVKNPIKKPDPQFAEKFEQMFNPDHSKTVIFIDDKMKNVEGLKRDNWVTLQFKDVEQLRADLQELGISLDKQA